MRAIENRIDTHKFMQNDAFVLAGLFSRIGTTVLKDDNRPKSADHLIQDYMTKWNIPADIIEDVVAIANNYRNFYKPLSEMSLCRSVLKYSQDAVMAALEYALCIAQTEVLLPGYKEALEENRWRLAQVIRRFTAVSMQNEGNPRYLTGREIMHLLNMKQGRKIGELLNDLDIAVGLGEVSSRARAEEWLKAHA